MSASTETATSLSHDETVAAVRDIQSSWKVDDFLSVASKSRALLERDSDNVYGLIYLARSAACTLDWVETARAAGALTKRWPLEAFIAARWLSRAGHKVEASRIFAELNFESDWQDDRVGELAYREGVSLLTAGRSAMASGDVASARVMLTAATRLAPRSRDALTQHNMALRDAMKEASEIDLNADAAAYVKAWRDVLWLKPSNVLALSRIAGASERIDPKQAIEAWIEILAVEPDNEKAILKVRNLAQRNRLEDNAIRALVAQGRDEQDDPLIIELSKSVKERMANEHQVRLSSALRLARSVDGTKEPRNAIEAWKAVLAADPQNAGAAKAIVAAARELGDDAAVVDGFTALLDTDPTNADLAQKLAGAAARAGREQPVLENLTRKGLADLSVRHIAGLHGRVLATCRNAVRSGDFPGAMGLFQTLAAVDSQHPTLEPLRHALANRAVVDARAAEKDDAPRSVVLAEQALQLVPDHPTALTLVARHLWRDRRFRELIEFCQPRVKPGPEYAGVQRLLERAAAA